MKRVKRKKSEKLRAHLKSALWHAHRADRPLYCHELEKATGEEYTDEQKRLLNRASEHWSEAAKLVKEVYAEMIGKAVVKEVNEESY